jgi:hypothetical protein
MKMSLLVFCWLSAICQCFSQAALPNPAGDTTEMPVEFSVYLSGANEVPPNNSPQTGSGWFLLEGNVLNYAVGGIRFAPVGAGIYGPAALGENGELIFDWSGYQIEVPYSGDPRSGGVIYLGGYVLSPEQVEQVRAGLWYVNIRSSNFPQGEVRGQICPSFPEGDCDGDGVPNKDDVCLNTAPGDIVDGDGCSIAQLVPCSGPWRNHRAYVRAVREQAFRFWRERRITAAERNAIVRRAEQSSCGHPLPPPIFRP